MKPFLNFIFCFFLLFQVACASDLGLFSGEGVPGQKWSVKKNVTLSWDDAQNVLTMEVDPAEFRFGWCQVPMPKTDYAEIAGIYGQFRAPQNLRYGLTALLVFPQQGAPSEYYGQEIGNSVECGGEWLEFYLPFTRFQPQRDASRTKVSPDLLKQTVLLELGVSNVKEKSSVEFRELRLVTQEEARTLGRRVDRLRLARQIKKESEITPGVHPRLLLHGERLRKIRAQAGISDKNSASSGAPATPSDSATASSGAPATPSDSATASSGAPATPSGSATASSDAPAAPSDSATASSDAPAAQTDVPTAPTAAYQRVMVLADEAMKKIDPEKPFGKIFEFERSDGLNDHKNRGRFEGTLNPLVIPLETLAAAAVITQNDVYGRHAARALANMARTLDADSPEMNQGFYYTRTFYVRALALGYDWLYDWLTPEERLDVKVTLLGFVQEIYAHSWTDGWGRHPLNRVWNWDPGLVSCAGLGVLAMQGETRAEEEAMLVQFRRHLRDYLTFGIDFDGCGHEGPSYLSYGIGAGVPFAECLREAGYGDLFTETNWQNVAPWLVAEILPNKPLWNNLSDCNHGAPGGSPVYAYVCGRLAELAKTDPVRPNEKISSPTDAFAGLDYLQHFREFPGPRLLSYGAMAELMGWAWNAGSEEAPDVTRFSDASALAFLLFFEECPKASDPGKFLPEMQFFRGRGLVVSREGGYAHDAFHLAVEAGPHAAGHDQSDKGSFTLRAYGQDFVIDSGYGNDGEPLKSGSSFAHNVVLIDGEGQPLGWHNESHGEITGCTHRPEFDWIRADARDAWNVRFLRWKKESTGMEVERADRHYLFVRDQKDGIPPYLVTYDDFRKRDGLEHDFTWQLHTSPEFQFITEKTPWVVRQDRSSFQVLTSAKEKVFGVAHGRATFTLTAPKDGTFLLAALTRSAGTERDKSDSFFVRINGGPLLTWDLAQGGSFGFCEVTDRSVGTVELPLKAGETVRVELTAREPEAQLAFIGLKEKGTASLPLAKCLSASQAVQDPKTPFLLCDSVTQKIEAEMVIFPFAASEGKTETESFQTSQTGIHPRLTHTVHEVEPEFLAVLLPIPKNSQPLPAVKRLKLSDGSVGAELAWPSGRTDTVKFVPGPNGKVPVWARK